MSSIALFSIALYQNFFSPLLKQVLGIHGMCRFYPTCSQYAKQSIARFGIVKGGRLSAYRLFQCQPFTQHPNVLLVREGLHGKTRSKISISPDPLRPVSTRDEVDRQASLKEGVRGLHNEYI